MTKWGLHKFATRLGLGLSVIAILWLLIPCAGHCQFLSDQARVTHDCCHPSGTSVPENNSTHNGLMDICISMSGSFLAPALFHFSVVKIIVLNSAVMTLDIVQISNITPVAHFWTIHSPPLKLATQLLITHLYTPHAPPNF